MKIKLLLLLIIALIVPIGLSYATSINAISISGKLNNSSDEIIHMKMHAISNATGSSNILLTGNGALAYMYNNGSSDQHVQFYVQGNMFSNDSVVFRGNVTKSSNPDLTGIPISITVDPSTGNMTLVFDGFSNYTGTGMISIR